MANILLAEDDASMRAFVAGALEKAGHRVVSCADGADALDVLDNTTTVFDLLLTDIIMPGLDGIELSGRAAALQPGIKIMFITGFAAMATGETDVRNPQMRIVSKPFHLGQLISEVNKILEG